MISPVRRRAGVLFVAVLCALFASATSADAGTTPFAVDAFDVSLSPGASQVVNGAGCPPASSLTTNPVLVLRLTPPSGGNSWGVSLDNGSVLLVSTAVGVPGEADVTVVPKADGTFSSVITIPANAPPAAGDKVRAVCTTLLVPGPGPGGFTQESYDASFTEAGALQVLAIPVVAPPAFTG